MRYKRKAQEAYLNSILLTTIKSKADFLLLIFCLNPCTCVCLCECACVPMCMHVNM